MRPAIVDFQTFLVDLRAAVRGILHDDTAFQTFARAVLGVPAPKPGEWRRSAKMCRRGLIAMTR